MAGRHDFIGHCGPIIIAPIKSGTCDDPPFYWCTTRHRRWVLSSTPPLLYLPREREPVYLSGSFSSVYFTMLRSCDYICDYIKIKNQAMDHVIRGWRVPKDFDPVLELILGFADSRFNPGSIKFGEYGPK
ncbi:hypothetical protein AVEN_237050-1 [Araneus ventricosus]|uniref:Uncharacterized protein n=1 Tax=Araneus ventricosus TaxID=182803 RepID=A0A4Y2PK26_ARAVE|nr:hypothetical protein AVEN_237050-1 [Araneus ventricosus]